MHVRVQVGTESYALPVTVVREVGNLGDVAQLPGAPPVVLGVHNLHGQVLPVLDLAGLLGLSPSGTAKKIVVAEHAGRRAALTVESITGVEAIGSADEEVQSPYLSGAALIDGALVGVLDLEAVFSSLRSERGR